MCGSTRAFLIAPKGPGQGGRRHLSQDVAESPGRPRHTLLRNIMQSRFLAALVTSPKAMFAVAIILLVVACALFSPQLAPYDPGLQSLAGRLKPPFSMAADGQFHLLGTDHLGRDILSRLIYGARISLAIGVGASLVAGTFGVLLGLVSGYFGGCVDDAS